MWQRDLLEITSDQVVTQEEVTTLMSDVVYAAVYGMIIVAMMTMMVKGFYEIESPGKHTKQEKEVLGMVEDIW